jgi:uncharacterized membrane protein
VGHHHSHDHDETVPVTDRTRRLLLAAVLPFLIATLAGLVILWPSGERVLLPGSAGPPVERYQGVITSIDSDPCPQNLPGQEGFTCSVLQVRLEGAPDETTSLNYAGGPNTRQIKAGDRIIVARAEGSPPGEEYYFDDFERGRSLVILAILFALVVIALSRWRGLTALIGTAISLVLLVSFVLPAILQGRNPLAVAIVGGAAIMFVALYLAHGVNAQTTTAVLGTLASLAVTGALALIFVEAASFTGFGSEEAVMLQISAQQVNLQGLLLGGIIIGTLGVLDDVTVTQASAVWQLRVANPSYSAAQLYRSALKIGRDHIASTVNTLVLAYAGASLPLLIVFSLANRPLGAVLTGEIVAEEIVRTLVGSIGLVASVPITTALAAAVAARDDAVVTNPPNEPAAGAGPGEPGEADPLAPEEGFRRPRAERDWRGPS